MKGRQFRKLALALDQAEEGSHMDHADFRIGGRIFASLAPDEDDWGMVQLNPSQQEDFINEAPHIFAPVPGAWGRAGATRVVLEMANPEITTRALQAAYQNVVSASEARKRKK